MKANKRKYPISLFIMGLVFNFLKNWPITVAVLLLFIIRLFLPAIHIIIPLILLIALLVFAVIKELIQMKNVLNMNPNEEANELLDKMFPSTNPSYKNVIKAVDEIIEKNQPCDFHDEE
ncbi:MAG: hypothetical protein FWF85_02150 [Clostridiales bacterium]|nr:hypothetical protein [Clostridiales bacterium]